MNSPCYNCTDKEITCHDYCPEYMIYKKKMSDIKKVRDQSTISRSIFIESTLRKMS